MAPTMSVEETEPKMARVGCSCSSAAGSAGAVETAALASRSGDRGCSGCFGCSGTGAWMGFRVKIRVSGTRKDRRAWARSA